METRWDGRNVDLSLLATRIADFFTERDFEVVKGKSETGHEILAHGSPFYKLLGYVAVTVEGDPQDFRVNMELCGDTKKDTLFNWRLLTMFGGGYFVLQKLKSDEALIKLEKEFRQHLENAALHLTNSAKSSNNSK